MESSDDGVLQFYVELDAKYGINFNATIKPKFQTPAPIHADDQPRIQAILRVHPDMKLITWVGEQLKIIMPILTSEFWHHEAMADA